MARAASLEQNRSIEQKEIVPRLAVAREEYRLSLREAGLPDNEQNREALTKYFESSEYRDSKRGRAVDLFEKDLANNPIEVGLPAQDEATRVVTEAFVMKVIREHAYRGAPENMLRDLEIARDYFSGDPEFDARFLQGDQLTSEDAREAAFQTSLEWARSLPAFAHPDVTEDNDFLNREALVREARLGAREAGGIAERAEVDDRIARSLRERIDALSFWRGHLVSLQDQEFELAVEEEREPPPYLQRFDESLAQFGIELDGSGAYVYPEDRRELRAGGDVDNFIEGLALSEGLWQEEREREARAAAQEPFRRRASDVRLELLGQPDEIDLGETEAARNNSASRHEVFAEEVVEESKKVEGFLGIPGFIRKMIDSAKFRRAEERRKRFAEHTEQLISRHQVVERTKATLASRDRNDKVA